ncbi:MAG: hypothetical protein ACOYYJ_11815 [Chloroflexota bacterium]
MSISLILVDEIGEGLDHLECADVEEAKRLLATLPLVQAGLIAFEIIPLIPYPGFERLFGE